MFAYADSLMYAFFSVFSCCLLMVYEEVMFVVGVLVYVVGENFIKYMDVFILYVKLGLENYEEY